ncbi:hypothetical protein GCM10010300_76130 [Streptomyces olivaceoviridis]|uniref:phosphopantetheine-binding protein n=1 Tax=Streptomyces olivaceoviridis TaxID=1921 RepID=UPI00167840D8|nr:phosphopantetheine-binding protein [Streptomyces olivaceoviridis]GGZ21059.1 hypothetical protein GCM10010300_76130 [Streptomyces olivaceoviridis]
MSSLLAEHPSVAQAHVRAFNDGSGPILVAYAVTEPGNVPELRAYLAERLPAAMRPAAITPLESLPLSTSGKLDQQALPIPVLRVPEESSSPDSPATTLELVAQAWHAVLKADQVDPDENFFDIDGHSMLLVQVQRRLADSLQRRVPVVELFTHPTVRKMATYLDSSGT